MNTPTQPLSDLHAAIMNLPCVVPYTAKGDCAAYKVGHRAARHAAAELAAAALAAGAVAAPVVQPTMAVYGVAVKLTDGDEVIVNMDDRRSAGGRVVYAPIATLAASPPAVQPTPGAQLSWGGHIVHGDEKSIEAVKQAVHDASTVPDWKRRVIDLESAAPSVQPTPDSGHLVAGASSEGTTGEPVAWQYRWLNPANDPSRRPEDLAWKEVSPRDCEPMSYRIAELQSYTYEGTPCYEVRPLFAARDSAAGAQKPNEKAAVPAPSVQAALPVVPSGLLDALRHQIQVDEDGVLCGVSREAVYYAIKIIEALAASPQPAAAPVPEGGA